MARLTVALRAHVAKEVPRRRGPLQAFLHALAAFLTDLAAAIKRLEIRE